MGAIARTLATAGWICAVLALGLVLPAAELPRKARPAELDRFVDAQRRWMRIPGLSLAVVEDGRVVKAAGYGRANVELNSPATAATAYRLGSISKQFLAAAVLVLQQDGKLSVDERLSAHLPGTPDAWKDITLRHLLTHTSGLRKEAPGFDPFKDQTEAEVIRSAYDVPLGFAPGTGWSYSNVGYYCLAEVVRVVSARPWAQFVAERVIAPAGMKATRITALGIVPGRATGYMFTRGVLRDAETWLAVRPSGGVVSSVLDMALWDAALRGTAVLDDASKRAMWTPAVLADGSTRGYGFGWFVETEGGHRRIRHDGGVPGFAAEIDRFVDDGLTVILLANVGDRDLRDLALAVASRYRPALAPAVEPAVDDSSPELAGRLRRLVEGLASGRLDTQLVTSTLADRLAVDLANGFGESVRSLGPLRRVERLEGKGGAEPLDLKYRLVFQYGTLFASCGYDALGRMTRLAIGD